MTADPDSAPPLAQQLRKAAFAMTDYVDIHAVSPCATMLAAAEALEHAKETDKSQKARIEQLVEWYNAAERRITEFKEQADTLSKQLAEAKQQREDAHAALWWKDARDWPAYSPKEIELYKWFMRTYAGREILAKKDFDAYAFMASRVGQKRKA